MADNTEMEAQSTSSTGMDFLVNSDVAAEELSQSGLETISETKQIETESRESETDEMIFPSKVKKNRKCVVLDSDDDDLMQEPEIKLSENLYETNTIAHSDETMFKNESHTNDSNQSGITFYLIQFKNKNKCIAPPMLPFVLIFKCYLNFR